MKRAHVVSLILGCLIVLLLWPTWSSAAPGAAAERELDVVDLEGASHKLADLAQQILSLRLSAPCHLDRAGRPNRVPVEARSLAEQVDRLEAVLDDLTVEDRFRPQLAADFDRRLAELERRVRWLQSVVDRRPLLCAASAPSSVSLMPEVPGGSIAGTVTDVDTTGGIEGETVYIYDSEGNYVTATGTDANGDYQTSSVLAAGTYFAFVSSSSGYLSELFDDIPCAVGCDVTSGTAIPVGEAEDVTGIDFALEMGSSIAGTVTDAATTDPIAGVDVSILNDSGWWVGYGYTGSDGSFRAIGLPADTYYAVTYNYAGYVDELYDDIICPGGYCTYSSGTPIVLGEAEDLTGIDFALDEGATISGNVSDNPGGTAATAGIENVEVDIYDASGYFVTYGYSDVDGNYTVYSALPSGSYFARTYAPTPYLNEVYDDVPCPGYCDVTTGTAIPVGEAEDVMGIDFALDEGGSVSGTITDASTTNGIANISVNLYNAAGSYVGYGSTDTNGDYTVYSALFPGTYYARTYNNAGYLNELYDDIDCSAGCDVTSGDPVVVGAAENVADIDFALVKGGSISGTITEAATSDPIEGQSITIYDATGNYVTSISSDATGLYTTSVGLAAGTYFALTSGNSGYFAQLYDGIDCSSGCDVTGGTGIVVGAGADVTGIDFALVEGASISGTVTDSATSDPIEGERVRIYDASGDYVTYDYTESDGTYTSRAALPAGTYYAIAFSYSGYLNELYDDIDCSSGCEITSGTPIAVGAGEDVAGIDFDLDKGVIISGTVTDSSTMAGIDDVEVDFYNSSGSYVGYGYTDANGDFSTYQGLTAGTYYARTYNWTGYLNELYDDIDCSTDCDVTTGTAIVAEAGEEVTGIDFALDKGGSISGTVIGSDNGLGIDDSRVYIHDSGGDVVASAHSDSSGVFRTSQGLPAGTYYLRSYNWAGYLDELYDDLPCVGGCDVTVGTPIVVGAGAEVTGIDFVLDKGASISGTVTDSDSGLGIQSTSVYVYDADGNYLGSSTTDSEGDYRSSVGLEAGSYFVRTYAPAPYLNELYDDIDCSTGCNVTTGTPVVLAAGEDRTGVDFALDRGASISGSVTDSASGLGIDDSRVYIYDSSGSSVNSPNVQADGSYQTTVGLAAGTYYAKTYNWAGYFDELYDNIPCSSGCDVTTGTAIVVGGGAEVTGVDFALDKGATVSGTVIDNQTMAGVEGIRVRLYDSSGSSVGSGYTDSNGVYVIPTGLVEGTYYASTQNWAGYINELYDDLPCPYGCDVTEGTPISVAAGATITGIDFALDKGASISGTVTDASTGAAVEDVEIDIYDSNGNYVTYGYTNASGNYVTTTGLTAGSYFARTYSSWLDQPYLDELYDNIDCSSGCSVTTGTLISVGDQEAVTGIDFALMPKPHFADGFESGNTSRWDTTVSGD